MRFIHTADWHLGNQMHDIDRSHEIQAFFSWLKQQIVENEILSLVISGDIFDTANPSTEARRLYYGFLASLAGTCCKNVIITGGNHDSAVMLECSKEVLQVVEGMNIHVVGSINNLEPSEMVFELKGKKVEGICIALPFVREVELRNFLEKDDSENNIEDCDLFSVAYKKLYDLLYKTALKLRGDRKIPIIATGHLYAADLEGRLNGLASNTKTDDGVKVLDVLGTLGNVPSSVFPPVDYVALGHIHYTSMVAKNASVRYSGSPFVMGFDEANIPHYVLKVEIEDGKVPAVEKIETPQTNVFRRISGTLEEIKSELLKYQKINPQKNTYLELCYKKEIGVNTQEFLYDAVRSLPQKVSVVSWKIMENVNRNGSGNLFGLDSDSIEGGFDACEIKNLDDKDIFTNLILTKTGFDLQSQEAKEVLEKYLPLFVKAAESIQ